MSCEGRSSRPARSRTLSEKGVCLAQEKVSKLRKEAEKIYKEAYDLVKRATEGRTCEIESSFDNAVHDLDSMKKSIEEHFDRLACVKNADENFVEDMSKLSEWLQDLDHRREELKKRFQATKSVDSCGPELWQLAASELLEEQKRSVSEVSSSSTAVARAEAAAAKRRMEMEKSKSLLVAQQLEEEKEEWKNEVIRREEEIKAKIAKKKREIALEEMKAKIEYEVAQARLKVLEEGSRAASVIAAPSSHVSDREDLEFRKVRAEVYEGAVKRMDPDEDKTLVRAELKDSQSAAPVEVLPCGDLHWMTMMAETQRALLYGVPKLAPFSGNPEDFFAFMASWRSTAGAPGGNPAFKLQLLQTNLDSKSRNLIEHCSYLNPKEGYEKAIKILYERYGRGDVLVHAFMEKMKRFPKIQGSDLQMLESFADLVDRSVLALEELSKMPGSADYVCMVSTVSNIASLLIKLPIGMREKFVKSASNNSASIRKLRDFLKNQSKEVNNPVLRVCQELEAQEHGKKGQKKEVYKSSSEGAAFATSATACFVCGLDSHPAFRCESFKQMSAKDRIDRLKKDNRCFNCFSDRHRSVDCGLKGFCKATDCGWRNPHSWLVHDRDQVKKSTNGRGSVTRDDANLSAEKQGRVEDEKEVEAVNTCSSLGKRAFLQVVPVQVRSASNPFRSVTCWAMLDPCSTTHFGTKKLIGLLGIKGKQSRVTLRTVNGTQSQNMMTSDVFVMGLERKEEFRLKNIKFQDTDELCLSAVPSAEDSLRWPQLESIVGKVSHDEVLLLIGLEASEIFSPGSKCTPYLVETGLGKAVQGLVGEGVLQKENVNFIEIENGDMLEHRVKKFFEVEGCEELYDDTKALSVEDRRAMEAIDKSLKKLNNRYEVRVPWRSMPPRMPYNRHVALHRLICQKKKFLHDQAALDEYAKAIEDYEMKGFAERVPDEEITTDEGQANWLCHHGVKHERKPLRIVFNASKICEGKSLNSEILQGPDLLSKLVGVLLRFRRYPVAVSADIKAFFHQVRIPKIDADFQRYLWFEDSDPTKRVVEMRMLVHLFGGVSSQTCSVAALHRCIGDAREQGVIDSRFAEKTLKSFYCDDFLRSFRSVEEAGRFSCTLREVLSSGGFFLGKFISTHLEVLSGVCEEAIADCCRSASSHERAHSTALGINWNVCEDVLFFPSMCKTQEIKLTKREVLSFIASIYDPLGMLGPVTASAKMILSAVFRKGLGWDEPLPFKEGLLFSSWMKSLEALKEFTLPRCVAMTELSTVNPELHLFSDGAETGFGSCAYIVFVGDGGRSANFLMSKSKVCSNKGKLTIPKVELCAAVLATRLARIIREEHEEEFSRVCFWTDSMSTLKMIKNDATRFKVFEANRLEEIRSCSDKESWRFVPGKQNPSDILTRPFQLDLSFDRNHWFFSGPSFIRLDEEYWPEQPDMQMEDIRDTQECHNIERVWNAVDDLYPRVGSWSKLRKFMAVVVRLQKLARGGCKKGCLEVKELLKAEIFVFESVQKHYFKEEVDKIKDGKALPSSHPLSKYTPFIKDGILRVLGRLGESGLDFNKKHPIILPKLGHVTELIVHSVHQQSYHGTPQMVLNCLREKFYIPDALRLIKRVVGRCFECKRYSRRLGEQIMANLPQERIAVNFPPFHHTGCDVAGPFMVKRFRKVQKRYVCVFTCMTIRAIHLESIVNLEAGTFINAFRRFLARRGPIESIRTDNALNFRGGDREIREAIEGWNSSDIGARPEFRNNGISWKYQTPKASSHSGVWERMIRSMRSHLRHVLRDQEVDEDVFCTVLVEVEAILNSRPLVAVSEDPGDLTSITPSMLLNSKQTCTSPPGLFDKDDLHLRSRWRQTQALVDLFWKRFTREYVSTLISRQKWVRQRRNFKEGDVVLLADEQLPRSHWPLGRVTKVYPAKDMNIRSCQIKTKYGIYDRPINKLALIETDEL